MTTIPPAVFANATRHFRTPSGDDKSRLNSRVFPSVRFRSSTRTTTPHSTRKYSSPQGFRAHQPDCVKTVPKPIPLTALRLLLSEKQIPQVVVNIKNGTQRMELLETTLLPRLPGTSPGVRGTPSVRYSRTMRVNLTRERLAKGETVFGCSLGCTARRRSAGLLRPPASIMFSSIWSTALSIWKRSRT